jgi:Skp family chaperone for outer membrane proteins
MNNPINITGSTINNNGILNLGEINGNVSQTIQQLPAEQTDLKALLSQLQTLINTSPLSETAKQKALTKTQDIAEATQQPEEEQQNIVQKTLGYFDGLADSLESGTETAIKLGEIVAGITHLFGL